MTIEEEDTIIKSPVEPFFSASTAKFILMNICTWNIYAIYWLYKNWKAVKKQSQPDISPILRTFFSIFFIYSLIKYIHDFAKQRGIFISLQVISLSIFYITAPVIPMIMQYGFNGGKPLPIVYDLLSRVFYSLLISLSIVPVNRAIEKINHNLNPNLQKNNTFTFWNCIGIAFGILIELIIPYLEYLYPELWLT